MPTWQPRIGAGRFKLPRLAPVECRRTTPAWGTVSCLCARGTEPGRAANGVPPNPADLPQLWQTRRPALGPRVPIRPQAAKPNPLLASYLPSCGADAQVLSDLDSLPSPPLAPRWRLIGPGANPCPSPLVPTWHRIQIPVDSLHVVNSRWRTLCLPSTGSLNSRLHR